MKKIILGLALMSSISAFAQVNGFKLPAPHTPTGTVVRIQSSFYAESIEDNGATVTLKGLYLQEANGAKWGIKPNLGNTLCQKMGYGEKVRGSIIVARKDLNIVKREMFIPGPNRVIDQVECTNP